MSLRNIAHNAVKSAVQQKRIHPARRPACVGWRGSFGASRWAMSQLWGQT